MKEWYQQTKEELLEHFHVTEHGLSGEEAGKRLAEKGENVLKEGKRKSTLQVFFEQFCDLLVVILIIAALISMVSGNVESTIVIIAVIVLNAILGTVQHAKAEGYWKIIPCRSTKAPLQGNPPMWIKATA